MRSPGDRKSEQNLKQNLERFRCDSGHLLGSIWDRFLDEFSFRIRVTIWLSFYIVFLMVLEWFWERLGIILAGHFGYFFGFWDKGSTLRKRYK